MESMYAVACVAVEHVKSQWGGGAWGEGTPAIIPLFFCVPPTQPGLHHQSLYMVQS